MKRIEVSLTIAEACLVGLLLHAVQRAKDKHPEFVKTPEQAVSVLTEEVGEFAQAVNNKEFCKANEEALDIMAVCARFLEREWKNIPEEIFK